MINISNLLTSIKMDLGIYQIKLPFDNGDQALYENLTINMLPVYSQYYPYRVKKPVNFDQLEKITEAPDIYNGGIDYRIPPMIYEPHQIVTILNVIPRTISDGIGYYGPEANLTMCDMSSALSTMAAANLRSVFSDSGPTWSFIDPDIVTLYNSSGLYGDMLFEFGLTHLDNFSTIPISQLATIKELSVLYTKKFLYNALKHYNEINTAFGSVNLRIDDWANAEQELNDYLHEMRDTYHLDFPTLYYT